MSLIGNPSIEFLDEPTTGVDPVSCRSLFKMLKGLNQSSMVLTTHRMDEAESLCDNIVIMVNGRFACYGSPGHLKTQYGQGYSLILKYLSEQKKNVQSAIMPCLKCLEEKVITDREGREAIEATYQLDVDINSDEVGGLSAVFDHLNQLYKQQKLIIEY